MRERKKRMLKRKRAFIRMSMLLVPLLLVLLLKQTVFAQTTYVISDGGRVLVHTTSTTDPARVLTEAGLALGADDTYTAQTENGVAEITVSRSNLVTVNNCGEIFRTHSVGETVGALLKRHDINLEGDVSLSVPVELETYSGLEIVVTRTVRQTETYTVSIPFETTTYYDSTIPNGLEVEITPGQQGRMLCTANVVYVNGEETVRTVTNETVVAQPVNRVVAIGAMIDPLPPEDPADELVIRDGYIYLPDGQALSYTGSMQATATAYSHLDPGCGFITATGTTVHIGTVAVDPRVIPLGTRMFIVSNDGCYVYGISTAEDTGSSIKQDKVDLYFPTYEECIQFGRRSVTVYFLG